MKLLHTVEMPDGNEIDIEFEGYPTWANDSFDYAGTHCTHGRSGTHVLPSYSSMADSEIDWDKNKYPVEVNAAIEAMINDEKKLDELRDVFCSQLESESADYDNYPD